MKSECSPEQRREILEQPVSTDIKEVPCQQDRGLNRTNGDQPLLLRIAVALEGVQKECQKIADRIQTPSHLVATLPFGEQAKAAHAPAELVASALMEMCATQKRIADHFAPGPGDIVGSDYLARKLDCTQIWVARMAAGGVIPKRCIVQGTGGGKTWKFHRPQLDDWLATRDAHLTGR